MYMYETSGRDPETIWRDLIYMGYDKSLRLLYARTVVLAVHADNEFEFTAQAYDAEVTNRPRHRLRIRAGWSALCSSRFLCVSVTDHACPHAAHLTLCAVQCVAIDDTRGVRGGNGAAYQGARKEDHDRGRQRHPVHTARRLLGQFILCFDIKYRYICTGFALSAMTTMQHQTLPLPLINSVRRLIRIS